MSRFVRGSCALAQGRAFGCELPARLVIVNARPRVVDGRLNLLAEPGVIRRRLVCALDSLRCGSAALVGAICCWGTRLELRCVDAVLGDAEVLEVAGQSFELAEGARLAARDRQGLTCAPVFDHHTPAADCADHFCAHVGAGVDQTPQGTVVDGSFRGPWRAVSNQ